jgi:C4-type Zn-finger protein
MLCSNCNETTIDNNANSTKCKGVEYNGGIVCVPCYEALQFLNDNPVKYKEKQVKQESNIKKSKYVCMKCNYNYDDVKCPECKFPNPLFMRKKK